MSTSKRIGRNDPCPCASGKKYKNCCLPKLDTNETNQVKPSYRFEPGSYGDVGNFMPSIACLKLTGKYKWEYHFILVKPAYRHAEEDQATAEADSDISEAFKIREIKGSDADFAMELRKIGYVRVDDFKIVTESKHQA